MNFSGSAIERVLYDRGFQPFRGWVGDMHPFPLDRLDFFSTTQSGNLYTIWDHPDGRRALYGIGEGMAVGLIQPLTPKGLPGLIRMEQQDGAEAVVDYAFEQGAPIRPTYLNK